MKFCFHPRATEIISGKSYRNARRILRAIGCTKSEQDAVISAAKKEGKIRLPN